MTPQVTTTSRSAKSPGKRGLSTSTRPSFRLQERDVEIVDAVYRHRVLTTAQIATLFFPRPDGSISSHCRARLRHLVGAGLIDARELPQVRSQGRLPLVYFLAGAGKDLLVTELGYDPAEIDWRPAHNDVRWPFLTHQLSLNDVYLVLAAAASTVGWYVARWVDDRQLKRVHTRPVTITDSEGRTHQVAVVPDAYCVICRGETMLHFFIEVDRGTMMVASGAQLRKSWQRRVAAYQAYFNSQAVLDDYKTAKIRILTVTTGEGRLDHLVSATAAVGGSSRWWFARSDELSSSTALTQPVWRTPGVGARQVLLENL